MKNPALEYVKLVDKGLKKRKSRLFPGLSLFDAYMAKGNPGQKILNKVIADGAFRLRIQK